MLEIDIIGIAEISVLLLLIASVVAVLARRLRIPYTVGLVLIGLAQKLSPLLQKQNDALVDAVREVMISDPAVEAEELDTARREALRAQRSALRGLLRDGVISESSYSLLLDEVDSLLMQENLAWPEIPDGRNSD
jgi:hypothetical protein